MEYGSGWPPVQFAPVEAQKSVPNFFPAAGSFSTGRPATETVMPSALPPDCWTSAEIGVNPSGARIFTFGAPARRSLISLPPFSQIRPPRNTACAPDFLILSAVASYDDAFASQAVKPTTLIPSLTAAFLVFVATPR